MPKLKQKFMGVPEHEGAALDSHADRLHSRLLLVNPYVDKDLYWYTLKTYNFSSASGENALLSDIQTLAKPFAAQDILARISEALHEDVSNTKLNVKALQKPNPESIRLDLEFSYRLHPATATKTVAARALLARLAQESPNDQGWLSHFEELREFLDGSVDAFEMILLAFILSHEYHDQITQPYESTSCLSTLSQPQPRTYLAHHILATASNPLVCARQDLTPAWFFLHPYLLARVAALLPDFGRLYIQRLEDATLAEANATLQMPEHPCDTLEQIERAWLGLLYAIPDSLELAERTVRPALRAGRDVVRERCLQALSGSQGVGREAILGVADVWAGMFARLEEMGGGGKNEPEAGSRLRSEGREGKQGMRNMSDFGQDM